MSIVGEFSKDQFQVNKEKKIRCRVFTSSIEGEIGKCQFVVVGMKKCTKKSDERAESIFLLSKPIALTFSLPSPSYHLNFPMSIL